MGFFSKLKNAKKIDRIQMVTEERNGFYAWNGNLYKSDIIRACIRPKARAVGKLVAKHIRRDGEKISVNPEPYIKFLLEEPNPYMTGQDMQEKITNQLALNNNAFILKIYDEFGYPCELYPIPCVTAEAFYKKGELYLRFFYRNGKTGVFPYRDIIHIRDDFNENDIFGESPAEALTQLMEIVTITDQGIVKAIKNSSVVRWLIKYSNSMRAEDLKSNVKQFVDNYLSIESDTFGAAGIDSKADIQRIEPKDYVPNALLIDRTTDRIYAFMNTNKKIVTSSFTEDEWNSYYEAEIEPVALKLKHGYTNGLFTRRERSFGNEIYFEASNLQCASISTKLALQVMVDRGAMTPNEWRAVFNYSPVPDGDKPLRRLDTETVNIIETLIDKLDDTNFKEVSTMINNLLTLKEFDLKGGDEDDKN